jgi:hypothetical protein
MSTLWTRCRDFVEEQAAGEWDDKTIANDADELLKFVMVETQTLRSALNQFVAACETGRPRPYDRDRHGLQSRKGRAWRRLVLNLLKQVSM